MTCNHCNSEWNTNAKVSSSLTTCPFCGKSLVKEEESKSCENSKDALAAIMNKHGADVLLGDKLRAHFSDYAPSVSEDIKDLIYNVYRKGAAKVLKENLNASQADKEIAVKVAIKKLIEAFVVPDMAVSIIHEFTDALGWQVSAPETSPLPHAPKPAFPSESESNQSFGYKSFAVTVMGGSHVKSGTVCQDASRFGDFNKDVSVSIAVVADGNGDPSCFRSDKGSAFAVACAREGIYNFVEEHEPLFKGDFLKRRGPPSDRELEKLIREKLIKQIVASWNMQVMEDYQKNPFTSEELDKVTNEKYRRRYGNGEDINKAYSTTLIAVAITPWYWFGFHVGDGRFSVLYEDGSCEQPVPWDPKCYMNVTTFISDEDILDREEGVRSYVSLHSEKAPPVAFFLCSHGLDANYPANEKENAECLYRLYREIAVTFAEDGYDPACGKDGKSGQIKDIANGFATKGKGDDTSLAGIVNIEKLKEVAPAWKEKMKANEAERGEDHAWEY